MQPGDPNGRNKKCSERKGRDIREELGTEFSVRRLASFDGRAFTDISPERSSHPTNPRAAKILYEFMTGDDAYFKQGKLKHGSWEQGFLNVMALIPFDTES
ncbi:hypothetical protein AVEN_251128-1 [Araneus ventricosus]|uniref:Uncharacterized protein n=1 Tax=Araneus ventricosus TaxID=182803 RepID=A0A4Y2VQ86_ARAVE|nr:hypothetical protein AVEN_10963-1 [Araneus ventricosus]GBO25917.1 hypothetical protein AVEN_251128-1 [Araneus ventricosus]